MQFMVQAATLANILPRQLSFKHTLQLWQLWRQVIWAQRDSNDMTELFILIAQKWVGNRSGRMEPRAVKRRAKPYALLLKPKYEAQAEERKNGHTKKIK